MLDVVILAAGKGTRMHSQTPKVLHPIGGKAMVQHVLDCATSLNAERRFVVVGHGAEAVEAALGDQGLHFVEQREQRGTGHAVQQVLPHLRSEARVLILYGDVPLIRAETLSRLIANVSDCSLALLTVSMADPTGYGRILRDAQGEICGIVEQKDASEAQRAITEVNTGVMAMRGADLIAWLPQLRDDNAQKEFYLTDVIALAAAGGKRVIASQPRDEFEVMGVNDRAQQAVLERHFQQRQAAALMAAGLTLMDPSRFDCRGSLRVGRDCVIDVNCVFEGDCALGDSVYIGPNCHLLNAIVGSGVEIKSHCVIENAQVGDEAVVGPYARLRPETVLAKGAKIGNFVEIKKATIGEGSKVNHLSYIGDAELGAEVNVGAGTITCNYDGVNKFRTTIGDGVFVGSNTAIVAPVTLAKNSTVGAGSVITSDVGESVLAVARARQRNVSGWQRPKKKPK